MNASLFVYLGILMDWMQKPCLLGCYTGANFEMLQPKTMCGTATPVWSQGVGTTKTITHTMFSKGIISILMEESGHIQGKSFCDCIY